MRKLFVLLTSFTLIFGAVQKAQADEGMWFLMFIGKNIDDMEKKGLQLTEKEIYDINHSSLKDAIVQFAGGCTAEIVSDKGLVLTNHHCGYGAIADLSTPENDYMENGFWAENHSAELKTDDLSVRFFVKMDDVSERILSKVNNEMSEDEREEIINKEIAKIEEEQNEGGRYTVSVRSFFEGNEYYYFVYEDFNDVRLVGTPPKSVGKYGGDTDNWEWPRHTGDFSMFRVYTDRKGKSSKYSRYNKPMEPKHHLPVSLKGYKEDDFSMILGYPGVTNRWMPASGVKQNIEYAYPAWVEGSKKGMDVLKKYMDEDKKVDLDYASKYAGLSNYWKNRRGMIEALKEHKTVDTKRKTEKEFDEWANEDSRKAEYGDVIKNINNYYKKTNEQSLQANYLTGILRSSAFAVAPYQLGSALQAYADADSEKREEMKSEIENHIETTFEGLYMPLEEEVLAEQLNLYYKKAKEGGLAEYVEELGNENGGDFTDYINQAFRKSIFTSKNKLKNFLKNPNKSRLEDDELLKLSTDLLTRYRSETPEEKELNDTYKKSFRLLVKGLRESKLSPIEYPDANSTLRLTYGTVRPLPLGDKTNDAEFNYYTTLKGTIAKHKEGDDEFENPKKLIELYEDKDYGQYADENGELWVNFLTDHDITGGNSGSPVLNGKGELTGIAFDGNIEAMAGDVIFDEELQRTISVDIRYVMFIIDKYADAQNIVKEMDLVK